MKVSNQSTSQSKGRDGGYTRGFRHESHDGPQENGGGSVEVTDLHFGFLCTERRQYFLQNCANILVFQRETVSFLKNLFHILSIISFH